MQAQAEKSKVKSAPVQPRTEQKQSEFINQLAKLLSHTMRLK